MSVPYASATSGERARGEIRKLRLLLAFQWRGHQVHLRASARRWADLYLRENPWNNRRRRCSEREWEERAVEQGMEAVNSILRDWVRGQITAVETGITEFRHVFLPYLVTAGGETVAELVDRRGGELLELPEMKGAGE